MFHVDKAVPIPEPTATRWPFKDMQVGDSFVVPKVMRGPATNAAGHYSRRHGMKFMTRAQGDSVRIWRTE